MKILNIVFFCFISFTVHSQITISGLVIDAHSKKSIPYATIINTNSKHGLYTTENGTFKISVNKNDSLHISCIGYKPITTPVLYSVNKNNSPDTFYLIPYSKDLGEVIVAPVDWSKYKEMKLGYANLKSNYHVSRGTGVEYAVYIPNTKRIADAYIHLLKYKIEKVRLDTVAIRLHLYAANADDSPSIELLDSNYIEILAGKMNKVLSFDVSALKIKFPLNGIFIGIEWLGLYDTKTNSTFSKQAVEPMIGFNFKSKEGLTYERKMNSKWELSDARKLAPSFEEEKIFQNSIPNPSFGIVIKAPKKNEK